MATTDPKFPPGLNNLIERIDSDRTDESPFGSTLTTPVDEDIVLFSKIEQRLVAKPFISREYGEEGYELGKDADKISGDTLLKTVVQDGAKLIIDDKIQAAPTPSPTLEHIPTPSNTSFEARMDQVDIRQNFSIDVLRPKDDLPLYESEHVSSTFSATDSPPSLEKMKPVKDDKIIKELLSKQPLKPYEDTAQIAKEFLSLLPFAHQSSLLDEIAQPNDSLISFSRISPQLLFSIALRGFLFLPWTILAGANILLFPTHLETIVFGLGYLAAPEGIYRFAFWADISKELVSIFLASLLVLWCIYPTIGLLAMGAVVAQFVYAWQGFQVDRRIPLGHDDQQSLYYVFKQHVSGDALESLREDDKGFYATDIESDYPEMDD